MRRLEPQPEPFDLKWLDDQHLPETALGKIGGHANWPDPRVLHQNNIWCGPDGLMTALEFMAPECLRELLELIIADADEWHESASYLEIATASTATRLVCQTLEIPWIWEFGALDWIESTELVHELRRRINNAY